jgi:hypothetical protein
VSTDTIRIGCSMTGVSPSDVRTKRRGTGRRGAVAITSGATAAGSVVSATISLPLSEATLTGSAVRLLKHFDSPGRFT